MHYGYFHFVCVVSAFEPWSVCRAVHMGVQWSTNFWARGGESVLSLSVEPPADTRHHRMVWVLQFHDSNKDFLSCGPPYNIHTTIKELLFKGFFGMLLLINKLRLLGSSYSLTRTLNIKQGPHLFGLCGTAHRYPLWTDLSWQFPTAQIKHEGLGRNAHCSGRQWKSPLNYPIHKLSSTQCWF